MSMNRTNSICFHQEDWQRLRETYRKWWAGELDRPIVPIITDGHESARGASEWPTLRFPTAWDFSIPVEGLVDACDAQLSRQRWHGEAFPFVNTNGFGPGVTAAFLGCTAVGKENTVWFQPPQENIPIEELHFEVDENNKYIRRAINFYEAAMEKWRGNVVIAMADLGGVMDVLASFRGSENLLMDLYDSPDEVVRCVNELQKMWFWYYDKINAVMAPEAMGYSHWFGMYCEEPGYILQSDFSYMIGPDMFDMFVAPELDSSAKRVKNAVYHLDGVGEIPHLDKLLAMDGVKGIQWVPGDGEPSLKNWDELLGRILASGKKLLSWAQKPDGRPIDIAKNPGQLYCGTRGFGQDKLQEAREYGALYGIEIR